MGSHAQVYIRAAARHSAIEKSLLEAAVSFEPQGTEWFRIDDPDDHEGIAERLSNAAKTTTVAFQIHTVSELIHIRAFNKGKVVRTLGYCADSGGWFENSGRKTRFEDANAIKAWMKEAPSASPDGYAILDAFLGVPNSGPKPPNPTPELEEWLIDELRTELMRQDRSGTWLVTQAWKHAYPAIKETTPGQSYRYSDAPRHPIMLALADDIRTEVDAECARLQCSAGEVLILAWKLGGAEVKKLPGIESLFSTVYSG